MNGILQKALRALAALVVIVLAVLLATGKLQRIVSQGVHTGSSSNAPAGEHKALYWYDAMNPQNHYDKPGKAPDGMDLVAKYADTASAAPAGKKVLYWYDPMHPNYKSSKPGKAPDCGMDLVPMYEGQGEVENGLIKVSAARQQELGVRTSMAEEKAVTRTLTTSGQVVPDETRIAHVHVRTSGWIEKVYADFVGQMVRKGQPLFTVYSPDLVAAQEEYLIAKRGQQKLGASPYQDVARSSQSLLDAARQRLKAWQMTDAEIRQLDESGTVQHSVTVYSPVSGYITDRKAYPNISVDGSTDIYTITDLSHVWVTADVYESELPYVKLGQTADVKLSYVPGRTFHGRVTYNYPVLDPQTHTAKVRIDVANAGLLLKPNMFADVSLFINYGKHVVVPEGAVLNSGTVQTVFVAHAGGGFEPRQVNVGATIDGQTIIEFGLDKGETVVSEGNFLLDSESRMKSGGTQ
ncbi:MAG: efflux RND transporter periplasmic adaptor subunit [Acidobacteriota bacterium]|nr:efflux RND transporter periplasmic adaptor subunit [Acidobacteriota bacterium]